MREKYAGADWVENSQKKSMSDFGKEVADVLGQAFLGIYHISKGFSKTNWSDKSYIKVIYGNELATYDGSELTRLVILCHDRCIRFAVQPASSQYIRLCFSKRRNRNGDKFYDRHPTMETAIRTVREKIGLPIIEEEIDLVQQQEPEESSNE